MVPPTKMLTTKNRVSVRFIIVVSLTVIITGCTPPGPRALLDGKRLLDQGRYAEAVARLRTATTLLSTNAQAWNYLGVAYHHAGQTTNAAASYQKALALNRNLLEARFNLGCLLLEQNNPDAAKAEFTAYTLQRPNAPEGWVKLGFAQLQDREIAAALKSFTQAWHLDARNADVFNGIGLALLQQNRPRDAVEYFAATLRLQPNHHAALLNQARVLQVNLNEPKSALEVYRKYLALTPKPDNWETVNKIARGIELQLTEQETPAPALEVPKAATNEPAPKQQTVAARQTKPQELEQKPEPEPERKPELKSEQKTEPAAPKPTPTPVKTNAPQPAAPTEVVTVPPEPKIKTATDVVLPPQTNLAAAPKTNAAPPAVETETAVSSQPEKRGFFQRLNPLNLFRREPKPPPKLTPLPSADTQQTTTRIETNAQPLTAAPASNASGM